MPTLAERSGRAGIWSRPKATDAFWGEYERRASRPIPVVLLEPVRAAS